MPYPVAACRGRILASALAVPLALPGVTVLAYYRADQKAYSDAGTTLATNGQTIRQWNDLTGNGYHQSQATGSARPTITLGASNYIAWDGTTSQMANAAIPLVAPLTVAAKLKLVNAGSIFQRVWRTTGNAEELKLQRGNVATSAMILKTSALSSDLNFTPATDNFLTGFHGIVVGYDNSLGTLTVNTPNDSGSSGSAGGELDTLGFQLGDTFTAFQLQELVIYHGLLSVANRNTLLAYFG